MSRQVRTQTLRVGAQSASELLEAVRRSAAAGAVELRLVVGDAASAADCRAPLAVARGAGVSDVGIVLERPGETSAAEVAALADAGLTSVELTVHAASARVHDAVERRSGAFDWTIASLRAAKDTGLSVRVRVPLWSRAAQDPAALVALLASSGGPGVVIQPGYPDRLPTGPNGDRLCPPPLDGLRIRLANLHAASSSAGLLVDLSPRSRLSACAVPAEHRVAAPEHPGDAPFEECGDCVHAGPCAAPPGWYVARYGADAVSPIRRSPAAASGGAGLPDWTRMGAAWDAAHRAASGGDVESAREATWEALGFSGAVPEGRDERYLHEDDISVRISNAVRHRGVDRIEEIAYLAGVKPVLYLTPAFDDVDALVERYAGHMVEVVSARDGSTLGRGVSSAHAHFFVSRSANDASFVAGEYRSGDPTAAAAAIGALMGYPECCARAFAAAADNSSDSANVYRVAHRSRGTGHAELNLGIAYLVPFYPCRFDCDAGADFARRTLNALFDDPTETAWIRERMNRPTLYFDKRRGIAFDGAVSGAVVRYDGAVAVCRSEQGAAEAALIDAVLGPTLCDATSFEWAVDAWTFGDGPESVRVSRQPSGPGILLPFGAAPLD